MKFIYIVALVLSFCRCFISFHISNFALCKVRRRCYSVDDMNSDNNIDKMINELGADPPFSTDIRLDSLRCDDEALKKFQDILNSVTCSINTNGSNAIATVSNNLEDLLSFNLPKLLETMASRNASIENDEDMEAGFEFIVSFLESFTYESSKMTRDYQKVLKNIMESMKISETSLDLCLRKNYDKISSYNFMSLLNADIEESEPDSPAREFLQAVKLRVLEEIGNRKGDFYSVIVRLATFDSFSALQDELNDMAFSLSDNEIKLRIRMLDELTAELKERSHEVDKDLMRKIEFIKDTLKSCV